MRIWFFTVICCLFAFGLNGQNVQWASRVIDYSSQLTSLQFSNQQVLNEPNVWPVGQESPGGWTPSRSNRRREFLKVGFQQPMKIQQLAIVESYNPSALYKVYAYDTLENEYLIETFEPGNVEKKGRILHIFLQETPFEVAAVKLVFKPRSVSGYFSIDAIGISASRAPVSMEIDIAENLRSGIASEPLDSVINSPFKEYSPLISPDGKTMYFSRKHHPGNMGGTFDSEDIWFSEWDEVNGRWKKPKNQGFPLNNFGPNYISTIAPDGKSMLALLGNLYHINGKMSSGLSVSYLTSKGWSFPEKVKVDNEYNMSSKANFFLSNNRRILMMSVEREDTYGQRDLYVSFLRNNDEWTEPRSLGSIINTADEETSPFLSVDNRTLFFSTGGFKGFGKKDIMVSYRLDDSWQKWSKPKNLGPAINSPNDDVFFHSPQKGKYAYFTRELDSMDADIYRVPLPLFTDDTRMVVLKGKVQTLQAHLPAGDSVFIREEGRDKYIKVAIDSCTGEYVAGLLTGKKYFVYAVQKDMLSVGYWIDLREIEPEVCDIYHHILMAPVKNHQRMILYHVDFQFAKERLKPLSYYELERVAYFLKDHPEVKMEIAAFTDHLGNSRYDHFLSERRAREVYNFLLEKGISQKRIRFRGYGSRKPMANLQGTKKDLNNRIELLLVTK